MFNFLRLWSRYHLRFFVLVGHENRYRKVASSNTSCLEAHAGFFRLHCDLLVRSNGTLPRNNFAVVTFLTKIQNWCYKTKKNLSNHNCQKNLDGKNHYHPRILANHKKVGSSRISISLFLLI